MAVDRNKEKFLNDLREYLSVLEEQEQEDILAEYAQHIDMKIQKGLSEEEAIRDFGSVKELAAEILAAYHVDSRHAMSVGRRGIWPAAIGRNVGSTGIQGPDRDRGGLLEAGGAGQSEEEVEEGLLQRMNSRLHKIFSNIVQAVRNGFGWTVKKCRWFADLCARPFLRKWGAGDEEKLTGSTGNDVRGPLVKRERGSESAVKEYGSDADGSLPANRPEVRTEAKEKRTGIMGRFFRAMGRGTVKICKWFLDCSIFGMRLFWNMAWLMFSVLCAGVAMLALMGIGMTIILVCGGYPFGGIFILELGGMLCFGALAAGAFGMMIRKKGKKDGGEDEKSGKEVHYEQTA